MQSKDFAVDVSDLHEGKLINISNNPYMIGVNYDADEYNIIHKETGELRLRLNRREISQLAQMAREAQKWPLQMRGDL